MVELDGEELLSLDAGEAEMELRCAESSLRQALARRHGVLVQGAGVLWCGRGLCKECDALRAVARERCRGWVRYVRAVRARRRMFRVEDACIRLVVSIEECVRRFVESERAR